MTYDDETVYYEALPVSGADIDDGDGSFCLYVPVVPENAVIQVYMAGDSELLSESVSPVVAE